MYNILISKSGKIAIRQEEELVELYDTEQNSLEGNIYLAKVQNVLTKMQCAFVNIGEKKNALIQYKDVIGNPQEQLKPGKLILVQVKKEPTQEKGSRVTMDISLVGKYVVLLPKQHTTMISSKITDLEEIERLKKVVRHKLQKKMGAIIRTSAENKLEEEIQLDIENLLQKWENICRELEKERMNIPQLLYQNQEHIQRILQSLIGQVEYMVTEQEEMIKHLQDLYPHMKMIQKEKAIDYDIDKKIEQTKKRKIWLKCGGFIVIDETEALTVIDVNSGKYIGTKKERDVILQVNKEATVEIAKQIRLRNLRGIIVIDYINMKQEEQKQEILQLMQEELQKDRAKTQVYGFTKLDLLELTRKNLSV